ncbi:uncharacterized protein LOC123508592 [Portunus trituberculatus]|uniref:uncharacterized protein LOC123508592 n=1 Tax=Portunus trituberculatus TaxID=210409 RepID=UPI001E1CC6B7|nr:uncharacterized protein LOC123508592 [Portunus trituberculatus]
MFSYNSVLIQNLVNASRGIVTAALFPVADLIKTLDIGQTIFKLQPLFNRDIVEHHYPILETVLTLEAVVIYVPFKSMDTFHAYEIIPFPFSINTSVLILDLPPTLVLIAKDFSVYTTTSRDSLSSCMSSYLHRYHCDATLFIFRPIVGNMCEVILTRVHAEDALLTCPYRHIVPQAIFQHPFHGYHYFFPTPIPLAVVCPNGTMYERVVGHHAVHNFCHVTSTNLTTYPKRLYEAFTVNISAPHLFPLSILQNLSFYRLSYVTNTLHEIRFSNQSEFAQALEESLPEYLDPVVFYPSLLVPILLTICILLPLFICVYKALRLYSNLHAAKVAQRRFHSQP